MDTDYFVEERGEYFVYSDLFPICNILHIDQLVIALSGKYGIPEYRAMAVLERMQRRGKLILSQDGYAMTAGAYDDITGDRQKKNLNLSSSRYLKSVTPEMLAKARESSDTRDCMWIVASMYPDVMHLSNNAGSLFNIMFVVPENPKRNLPSRFVEIIRFPAGMEAVFSAALFDATLALKQGDSEFWNSPDRITRYVRIVLLSSADSLKYIPDRCGVNIVAVLDPESENHYTVIRSQTPEEAWGNA